MANKIIHKHSNVVTDGQAKLPTSSQLEYGELAINYADGVETISIRNSADEIIEFRSKEYIDGVLSDTKDKVDTLEIDFEEHEEVVATALTVLNKKIDEFDNTVGTAVNERIESLENAFQEHEEVAAEAINDLDERVKSKSDVGHTHVSSNITGTISAASGITSNTTLLTQGKAVYNYAAPKNHTHQDITNKIDELKSAIEDNEFVVSTAINELNDRVKGNEDNITNLNVSINKNKTIDVTPLFEAEGFIPNMSIKDISDKHLVYYGFGNDSNANITFLPVQNINGNPSYGVLMADVFVPDEYVNGEMRTSQYSIRKYVNFIYSKTIDGVDGIYAADDAIEISGYMISPFNFVEKNDILTNLNEIKSLNVTPLFTQGGTIEGIGIDGLCKKTLYYNGMEGETDVPAKLYPIGDDSSTTMVGGHYNKAFLICEKIIAADGITTAPSVFNTSTFVSLIEEKFDQVNNIVSVECLSATKKALSGNQVNPKITNTLNVTDINAIKAAQLLLNESNDVAFFLITDSQGNLPSKNQDAVSVSKECIKQLSLSSPNSSVQNILKNISDDGIKTKGMSVGDIIALSRVPVSIDALGNYLELSSTIISALKLLGLSTIEIYQYKIWSTNDAKWTNYYNPDGSVVTEGVAGLVSPWAQDMIGKVPEAVLRPTKYAWGTNFDEMLENGVLSYGTPSGGAAPGGLDENFTVIVDASTTPDGNGYYTIKQTALGRSLKANERIFERFIFYNPNTGDKNFYHWTEISETANKSACVIALNKNGLPILSIFSGMPHGGGYSDVVNCDVSYFDTDVYYDSSKTDDELMEVLNSSSLIYKTAIPSVKICEDNYNGESRYHIHIHTFPLNIEVIYRIPNDITMTDSLFSREMNFNTVPLFECFFRGIDVTPLFTQGGKITESIGNLRSNRLYTLDSGVETVVKYYPSLKTDGTVDSNVGYLFKEYITQLSGIISTKKFTSTIHGNGNETVCDFVDERASSLQ